MRAKKELHKILEEEIRAIQEQVIHHLDEEDVKSFSYVNHAGYRIKTTRVQQERLHFHEAGLKKTLGSKMWNKVTKRVLDQDKLVARIQSGDIDEADVAKNTETTLNRPYVKFTVKLPTKG